MFPGQPAQAGIKRDGAMSEVLVQFLCGFGEGFLDNVGGIETGEEPAVEAHGDHAPQLPAMAIEQLKACGGFSLRSPGEELIGVVCRQIGHAKACKSVLRKADQMLQENSAGSEFFGREFGYGRCVRRPPAIGRGLNFNCTTC